MNSPIPHRAVTLAAGQRGQRGRPGTAGRQPPCRPDGRRRPGESDLPRRAGRHRLRRQRCALHRRGSPCAGRADRARPIGTVAVAVNRQSYPAGGARDGEHAALRNPNPLPRSRVRPRAFLVVPARTFADLRIGEVFRASCRTLTDAHAAAFQTVRRTTTRCITTPSGPVGPHRTRRARSSCCGDDLRGEATRSGGSARRRRCGASHRSRAAGAVGAANGGPGRRRDRSRRRSTRPARCAIRGARFRRRRGTPG
ncbi:hypothetical protein SAFG77S_02657 [Streptomyces afghaniensis]